jgi:hypothetical protein
MDKQLEEQLERMRRLNEQLNEMRRGVTETQDLIARDRRQSRGPLHDIRDLRTYQSPQYEEHRPSNRGHDAFSAASEATPRRRRRR